MKNLNNIITASTNNLNGAIIDGLLRENLHNVSWDELRFIAKEAEVSLTMEKGESRRTIEDRVADAVITATATVPAETTTPTDVPVIFKKNEKKIIFALVDTWTAQTLSNSKYKLFFMGKGKWANTYISSDKRVLAATAKTISRVFPKAKVDYDLVLKAYTLMERAGLCHIVEDKNDDGNVIHRHIHMSIEEAKKLKNGYVFLKNYK